MGNLAPTPADTDTVTIVEGPSTSVSVPTPGGLSVGATFGRYVVLETLGEGGMGVVVRAYDPRLRREVAVKRLRRESLGKEQERLVHEARAMAQLSHPNVVAVYDVEETPEGTVIAMELALGQNLRRWLEEHRPWPRVVEAFVGAGRGLVAAHAVGLVHRDFKPDNVLIGDDGRVRVTDFGLAHMTGSNVDGTMVTGDSIDPAELEDTGHPRLVFGTPPYMAPEQHQGMTDARSDQYSFCVALWEALCGLRPFGGRSAIAMAERKLEGPPPWPGDVEVPRWLVELVRRGLSPEPHERWPSMEALLDVLEGRPDRRRRRIAVGLGGALLLVGAGVGLGYWTSNTSGCTSGQERIASAWNDARRQAVDDRFRSTGRGYVAAMLPAVVEGLDDYTQRWGRHYDDACTAHERAEQSAQMLDLRMRCLNRSRAAVTTVSELLAAPDADVVDRALTMIDELPSLERCDDEDGLLASVAPPEPAIVDEVDQLRAALVEIRTLASAGLHQQVGERLGPLQGRIDAVGYPPLSAEMEHEQGQWRLVAGDYLEAQKRLERAYALALRSDHDEAAAVIAKSLVYVVGVRLARYDEGMAWAQTALGLSERVDPGGATHLSVLSSLGIVLLWRDDIEGAEARLLEAQQMAREHFGEESLPFAKLSANLAIAYEIMGEYQTVLALTRRALEINTKILGPEHPVTTGVRSDVANALRRTGDLERARELFAEVLATQRRTLDPGHQAIAHTLANSAAVEFEQGRMDEALAQSKESAAIIEARLGPEHPEVSQVLMTLGVILVDSGDFEGGLALLERVVRVRERSYGGDHPQVAWARGEVALANQRLGRPDEAERQFRRALESLERRFGPDNAEVIRIAHNLASLLLDEERLAEAEAIFRRVVRAWEVQQGPESSDVAMALSNLGSTLASQGRYAEATEVLERSLEVRERILSPEHPRLGYTLVNLADVHLAQGRLDQAEQLYERSLSIRKRALGERHPDITWSMLGIADVQQARGRLGESEATRRASIEILEQALRSDSTRTLEQQVGLGEVLLERGKIELASELLEDVLARLGDRGGVQMRAEAQWILARVLWRSGSQRSRARALAEGARDVFGAAGQGERRFEVERWLAERSP